MIVDKALAFATQAHEGQLRKYTNEPYINHPIAVAELVATVSDNQKMIAAALLHDTVEDTEVTLEDIFKEFGKDVTTWVENLTDVSKPEDGNRANRKMIDLRHTELAAPPAKTIKLADLIDNARSIVVHDHKFALVYMKEKRMLLDVLKQGNAVLYTQAKKLVDDYFNNSQKR